MMTGSLQHGRSVGRAGTVLLTCGLAAAMLTTGSAAARPSASVAGLLSNSDSSPPTQAPPSGDVVLAASTRKRTLPEVIGARPRVRQMITVSSRSFGSTTGSLKAWRRAPRGEWVLARGPVQVVLGYNGWVKAMQRLQGTGTTPAGRFRLPYAFGNSPDPGARLGYRHVDAGDWWPYEPRDPATYNVFQQRKAAQTRWRGDYAEHLTSYGSQYAYALVVDFNLPSGVHYSQQRHQRVATKRADTARGGGIFLHVRGDGLTAGCVATNRRDMRWLVRWVRPGARPRLVMGPRDYIVTL